MGDTSNKPFAYFLAWPAEASLGQDKFFGADSHRRMQQKIDYSPEGMKPEVIPLYKENTVKVGANIEINWISSWHDCETCGGAGAEGAVILVDGKVVVDMAPDARCYNGTSFSSDEVWDALLAHLGYNVTHK